MGDQPDADTKALKDEIEAQAERYAKSPQDGYQDGYRPEMKYAESQEVGGSSPLIPARTPQAAWLYGIARKDLAGRSWRIIEANRAAYLIINR